MKNKTTWRSFTTPYRPLVSTQEYELTKELLNFLTQELNQEIKNNWTVYNSHILLSRGNYWNETNKQLNSPAKKWPKEIGQRAKYYRALQEQIRCLALSLKDRAQIALTASKHNWIPTKALRGELTQQNLYPTNSQLQNICRAQTLPKLPANLQAILDFTVQDKQTITQNGLYNEILIKDQWIKLNIPQPKYLHKNILKYAKPKLWLDKNTNEIQVTIAYQIKTKDLPKTAAAVLGVDLGFIKRFTAAAVKPNRNYSIELRPSKELDNLAEKLEILQKELTYCYERKNRLIPYLVAEVSEPTLNSFYAVEDQIKLLQQKRTRVKDQLCWLAARDIVAHAVKQGCKVIHLEDLRFASEKRNLWDFSRLASRIEQFAELVGIEVAFVDAAYSSQTDPFTRERVGKKDSKRELTLSDGSKIDGDYSAALELAQRTPRKKLKSKAYATQVKIRARGSRSEFERAKPVKRSRERKELIKLDSGVRPIVALPAQTKADLTATCEPSEAIQTRTKQCKLKQYE